MAGLDYSVFDSLEEMVDYCKRNRDGANKCEDMAKLFEAYCKANDTWQEFLIDSFPGLKKVANKEIIRIPDSGLRHEMNYDPRIYSVLSEAFKEIEMLCAEISKGGQWDD